MAITKQSARWIFSPKQLFTMYWWQDSEWGQASGIIADGSVRSGKTTAMSFGFIEQSRQYKGQNFGLCGKTIQSFERNVLTVMKLYCRIQGYRFAHKRATNKVTITFPDGNQNDYYLFGGKDEGSQDLIQGITLAGLLLDEVALMPESFVNQALARCSVTGAKVWMNCNPANPSHFVKTEFIDKNNEKNYIYTHYTMNDNLSLSEERRRFYMSQWKGVFYRRYVDGEWVSAEGAIYEIFSEDKKKFMIQHLPQLTKISIGLDYGASKSRCALEAIGITSDKHVISLCESHMSGIKSPEQIYEFVESFIYRVLKLFGRPQTLWCDYGALGQVITRGVINYLHRKGVPINVRDCLKGEIIDRILLTTRLMGEGRYHMTYHCPELSKAFENALWEEEKIDTRLDDGTSDIDSLDSFEYAIYSYADILTA